MGNILIAVQAATALLAQLVQINAMIQQAQAAGVDITLAQLAALTDSYNAAMNKLQADIAAAKAAGH